MARPLLEVHELSKTFPGPVTALHSTNLSIDCGDDLVLLGPSGSGKSTLLRLIAGLEVPTSGSVQLHGEEISNKAPSERSVALLTQRPALFPQLTAGQNLESAGPHFPNQAIELLGIGNLLDRYPHQLSGGEKQRVALARLHTRKSALWLLDEPFNGLDLALRQEFRLDLLLLKATTGATMLVVTHDPADAHSLGRQIGVLGNGRLLQVGPSEQLSDRPEHLLVWQSLGLGTLITGHAVGGEQAEFHSACGAIVANLPDWLRGSSTRPSHLTLGIRPEELLVDSPGLPPPSSSLGSWQYGWPLILVEPVGRGWYLTLARGRTRIKVFDTSHAPPPVGCLLNWYLPTKSGRWYDSQSGLLLRSPE